MCLALEVALLPFHVSIPLLKSISNLILMETKLLCAFDEAGRLVIVHVCHEEVSLELKVLDQLCLLPIDFGQIAQRFIRLLFNLLDLSLPVELPMALDVQVFLLVRSLLL